MNDAINHPPFFTALQPRTWTPNRLYRVFVLPDEWVCVWAGRGQDVAMAAGVHGGLIGGLLAAAASPAKKNALRGDELDNTPLDELRDDHKHNFAIDVEDIDEAALVKPSFWFRINHSSVAPIGLLRLSTGAHGRLTLALTTHTDLRQAAKLAPAQLGDRFRLEMDVALRGR